MPLTDTPSTVALTLQFAADWLSQHGPARFERHEPVEGVEALIADGTLGDAPLALALVFIVPPTGADPWHTAKADLERRIGSRVEGGYLVWAPQGVALPEREPSSSEAVLVITEELKRYVPGGRGEARFPVPIYLRKSDNEGTYVTARGGLAPHWARFTGRVFGHFQLDSTELHRIPAGEGNVTALIDDLVNVANGLELGKTAEYSTIDAWVAQRLRGGSGVALIGEPPTSELSSGAGLRRSLRRAVQALRGPLHAREARRVVLCIGPYTSIEQQPVGVALLGFDPGLYQGLDLIAVAAEGEVQPVVDLTRHPELAPVAAAP